MRSASRRWGTTRSRCPITWSAERGRLLDSQVACQAALERLVRAAQDSRDRVKEVEAAAEALRAQNRRLGAALRRSRSRSATASCDGDTSNDGNDTTAILLGDESFLEFAAGLEGAKRGLLPDQGDSNRSRRRIGKGSIDLRSSEFEEERKRLHQSLAAEDSLVLTSATATATAGHGHGTSAKMANKPVQRQTGSHAQQKKTARPFRA